MLKISIIVPVYNVSEYLKCCLDSLVTQDFDGYEIILVNDGSTDDSGKVCEHYAKSYLNIKYFCQPNYGQAIARNFGMSMAGGQYLIFVDSDDVVSRDLCRKSYSKIVDTDYDFVCFGFAFRDCYMRERKIWKRFSVDFLIGNQILIDSFLDRNIHTVVWNKIYNKNFLNRENIDFPDFRGNEDIYFTNKAASRANKVGFLNSVLYFANIRDSSTSRTVSPSIFDATSYILKKEFEDFRMHTSVLPYFYVHVVRLWDYMVYQVAFRAESYNVFARLLVFAKENGYDNAASMPDVFNHLSVKNKLMHVFLKFPRLMYFVCKYLSKFGIKPY